MVSAPTMARDSVRSPSIPGKLVGGRMFSRSLIRGSLVPVLGLALLSPLIGPSASRAQSITLPSGLVVTDEQLREIQSSFEKLPEAKVFYHWTKIDVGMRWIQQGFLDKGEVDFYNRPGGDRQAHGSGIYLAESPESSKAFGSFLVQFVVPANTPVYSASVVERVLGRGLTALEITELGKSIPFIRKVMVDWWLTHHPDNTASVSMGDTELLETKDIGVFYRSIEQLAAWSPEGQFLESVFHLTYYMDGISLQRALRVAPENPWSQFEPENFESFRSVHRDVLRGTGLSSRHSIEAALTDLKDFQKRIFSYPSEGRFRSTPVRGGGRDRSLISSRKKSFQMFAVTPLQLATLLANPYLNVHYILSPDKKEFLATYEYPDIRYFTRLRPLLSNEFVQEVEREGIGEILAADRGQIGAWTERMIEDLVRQVLTKHLSGGLGDPAALLVDLMSVHPFSDGNGRSIRLLTQKLAMESGFTLLAPLYISDFDLLLEKKVFSRVVKESVPAYARLYQELVQEWVLAKRERRAPRFWDVKAWQGLDQSLSPIGLSGLNISSEFDQVIYERRFDEVFSRLKGEDWGVHLSPLLGQSLKLAQQAGMPGYTEKVLKNFRDIISLLRSNQWKDVGRLLVAASRSIAQAGPFPEHGTLIQDIVDVLREPIANPPQFFFDPRWGEHLLDALLPWLSDAERMALFDLVLNPSSRQSWIFQEIVRSRQKEHLVQEAMGRFLRNDISEHKLGSLVKTLAKRDQLRLSGLEPKLLAMVLDRLTEEGQVLFFKSMAWGSADLSDVWLENFYLFAERAGAWNKSRDGRSMRVLLQVLVDRVLPHYHDPSAEEGLKFWIERIFQAHIASPAQRFSLLDGKKSSALRLMSIRDRQIVLVLNEELKKPAWPRNQRSVLADYLAYLLSNDVVFEGAASKDLRRFFAALNLEELKGLGRAISVSRSAGPIRQLFARAVIEDSAFFSYWDRTQILLDLYETTFFHNWPRDLADQLSLLREVNFFKYPEIQLRLLRTLRGGLLKDGGAPEVMALLESIERDSGVPRRTCLDLFVGGR